VIRRLATGLAVLIVLAVASAALAFDAEQTFAKGSFLISPEAAYGHQFNFEGKRQFSDVQFANAGVRFGWLPFAPAGPGPLHGSLEVGVEALYQQYFHPDTAYFAGVGVAGRYHFLSLGRFVPYAEVAIIPGATNLKVFEIRSTFAFVLWGGVGASYFIGDRTALYAGYRWEHISNGNTSDPNRGLENNSGVFGVSFFLE
jgi:lipid A 3-O-deacylase